MTKKRFHTSLQLKLTLLLSLLMIVSCVLMYFFISHSAVSGMDGLQNYMIKVDPQDGDSPITFNVDPKALFPQFQQEIQETKEAFLLRSVIATTIIILLSSVCTYFLTKKALTPLQKLTSEVSQIQAQNLSTQLPVPNSKDEIAQLTSSFNEMLTRLDNAFSTQKQFSANAAHELRTPLAVLQTNLEVFARKKSPTVNEYQDVFRMIQEQTERLSHLSEVLLDMTGIQSIERSDSISLAVLADEVCCDLISIAEQKDVELLQEDGDSTVTGSYLLLYRAVYNLVENAIKYNHPGGKVTIRITQKPYVLDQSLHSLSTDCAFIEISDTGIGISPEYQKKIFEPFFRVDKSRSRAMGGAGLGLALVSEIALQHGGQVKVLKSGNKGSTIALILPL